jgi:hypothetical protein
VCGVVCSVSLDEMVHSPDMDFWIEVYSPLDGKPAGQVGRRGMMMMMMMIVVAMMVIRSMIMPMRTVVTDDGEWCWRLLLPRLSSSSIGVHGGQVPADGAGAGAGRGR